MQKPQGPSGSGGGSGGPGIPVFFKNLGLGVILAAALLVWLATGFFIVQEGQQAVITQFGKYTPPWELASIGACLTPCNATSWCL